MRKTVRLSLALFAVLLIMTGTASADEYDSMWVSFLDYDTGTSQGNYSVFSGSVEFSYTLPFRTSVRSVQGIIHASSHPITAVKFGKVGSSTTYPCTLIPLGNSLYRFYLSRTDVIVNSNEFSLLLRMMVRHLLLLRYYRLNFLRLDLVSIRKPVHCMSLAVIWMVHLMRLWLILRIRLFVISPS